MLGIKLEIKSSFGVLDEEGQNLDGEWLTVKWDQFRSFMGERRVNGTDFTGRVF